MEMAGEILSKFAIRGHPFTLCQRVYAFVLIYHAKV